MRRTRSRAFSGTAGSRRPGYPPPPGAAAAGPRLRSRVRLLHPGRPWVGRLDVRHDDDDTCAASRLALDVDDAAQPGGALAHVAQALVAGPEAAGGREADAGVRADEAGAPPG